MILLGTAATLGFLHTVLGPDHYVPFVMMARAQAWSRRKTAVVTFLCGFGHVASSLVIGALLAWGGMAAADWAWGTIRACRGVKHSHTHIHADTTVHTHEHDHQRGHVHVHTDKSSRLTPWVLFTIFVFGPCESLIPLMLSAWSIAGGGGVTLVSLVFGLTTIFTIMGAVALLLTGIQHLPLGKMDRWSTSLAGLSLVACGGAIQWLGL
jgi:hypothetical protein